MTGLMLLAAWASIGIALAMTRRVGAESSVTWAFGGAVLGPFWYFVTVDQLKTDEPAPTPAPADDAAATVDT